MKTIGLNYRLLLTAILFLLTCRAVFAQPGVHPPPVYHPSNGATVWTPPVAPNIAYSIKSKSTGKALDVKGGSNDPGAEIWIHELNHTSAQRFVFEQIGGTRDFKILSTTGENLLLTAIGENAVSATVNASSSVEAVDASPAISVKQDTEYTSSAAATSSGGTAASTMSSAVKNNSRYMIFQTWDLVPTGESNTFYISNKAFPKMLLEAIEKEGIETVMLTPSNNSTSQKWIITPTLGPNPSESETGLSSSLWIDAKGWEGSVAAYIIGLSGEDLEALSISGDNLDVNKLYPQLRPVGFTNSEGLPTADYEVLEGTVTDTECNPSHQDFPTSHYSHDWDYHIIPDKRYQYLLSLKAPIYETERDVSTEECANCWKLRDSITKLGNEVDTLTKTFTTHDDLGHPVRNIPYPVQRKIDSINKIKNKLEVIEDPCPVCTKQVLIGYQTPTQSDIEVEWECGLGQKNIAENITGASGGFCTEGHQKGDVIWNWATPGDHVHVEGIWSWDRGHTDVTEIHPASFMAVQRKSPVSFVLSNGNAIIQNQLTDDFFATRTDVYASGDGSPYWNFKNRESFSQEVPMNRKDYVFTIKSLFNKPSASSKLAWKVITRPGNTFPYEPVITDMGNGEVQVKILWKTQNVSNDKVLAKTILIYWNDAGSKGIPSSVKPRLYDVKITGVQIEDNSEAWDMGDGEWRMFCNVGSDWVFLNEFCGKSDILDNGLGDATAGYLVEDELFHFDNEFRVYALPAANNYPRIYSGGWECDAIDKKMGKIKNYYTRDKAAIESQLKNFITPEDLDDGYILDDDIGDYVTAVNATTNGIVKKPCAKVSREDAKIHNAISGSIAHYDLEYSISQIDH